MSFLGFLSGRKKEEEKANIPENTAEHRFLEMTEVVENQILPTFFSQVKNKRVLEIAPRHTSSLSRWLTQNGSSLAVQLIDPQENRQVEGQAVLSKMETFPFLDETLDFVLMKVPLIKGALHKLLREGTRVLKKGGFLIVADLHPFNLAVQRDHLRSAVTEEGLGPGLERYFRLGRENSLTLSEMREIFYDGSLKKYFLTDSEKNQFEMVKKTPFLIFMSFQK